MKLLSLFLKSSRSIFALCIFLGLLSGGANAGLIALLNRALARTDFHDSRMAVAFFATGVLALAARICAGLVLNRLNYQILHQVRLGVCRRVLEAPLRHLEQRGPQAVLTAIIDDSIAMSTAMQIFPQMLISGALIVGCLGYLVSLSWQLFLGVFGVVALAAVGFWWRNLFAAKLTTEARISHERFVGHVGALIRGLKELKLHAPRRNDFRTSLLEATSEQYRDASVRSNRIYIVNAGVGGFVIFFFVGMVLFVLPHLSHAAREALTGYALVVLFLQQPFEQILGEFPHLMRGDVALRQLTALGVELGTEPAPELTLTSQASMPPFRSLALVDVVHRYRSDVDGSQFELGPLSLEVARGEVLFIVGGNGGGKTTLAKTLTGLYEPESGRVLWNGEQVDTHNREAYRQLFSTVFSDFQLFDSMLGISKDVVAERGPALLQKLQLTHKVTFEDGRLSSLELSQGQRKRLALLCAYLEDRPVYVFDEWAADQDPRFKEIFYRELIPEMKRAGKTVIVISHDERYFGVSDRIVYLDEGKLTALPLHFSVAR